MMENEVKFFEPLSPPPVNYCDVIIEFKTCQLQAESILGGVEDQPLGWLLLLLDGLRAKAR